MYAVSRVGLVQLEMFAYLHDRLARAFEIERKLAANQRLRVQVSKQQIRIRDSWLRSAAAVTNGTRFRSGAARADFDAAGFVHRGDTAAAGADFRDVDSRNLHRVAGTLDHALTEHGTTTDLGLAADAELIVFDNGCFGGRTAHVEHHHVPHPTVAAHTLNTQH